MKKLIPLLLLVLGLGVLAGYYAPRDDVFFALRKNFQIFAKLYEELAVGYVDELDPEQVMRHGIAAMLNDLDPYTVFYDEAANEDMIIRSRGGQAGPGLQIGLRDGRLTVLVPEEGSSAYEQGLRVGDVITHVDNRPVEALTVEDVGQLLQGDAGTTVSIRIQREGLAEPQDFVLTRALTEEQNVTFSGFVGDEAEGIGYVRLEMFGTGAAGEVRQAVEQLHTTGRLQSVVLDLRGNPGGLLNDAVDIVGLFVPQNTVAVSIRGRLPEMTQVYRTRTAPLLPDMPVAVLMDENSASASEIVAGALQDLDRGVIVGEPSFGKGLVQLVRGLPYNTSLKLTVSRYYTPSGRSIQKILYGTDGTTATVAEAQRRTFRTAAGRPVRDASGIEPDVAVVHTPSELEAALLQRAFFFRFADQYAAAHASLPANFEVDDALLREFRQWLDREGFSYVTETERKLQEVSSEASTAGYDGTDDEFAALRRAIEQAKSADFQRHADALKARLRQEILARYLSTSDLIRATMPHDDVLQQAIQLMKDERTYRRTLGR